ncbi:MAG: hypothetical protein Q8P72_04470 [Candidatus Roizmanbacteria bacterium]|nr:hypothetical protein [Candidatus Roizmanbacteria bacterium]
MIKLSTGTGFASLFKKYRLRSGIETLKDFGDLLAKEGIVYEDSLFTRWQNGERIPKERKILLSIIKIFLNQRGIHTEIEANQLLESAGQGFLTNIEKNKLDNLLVDEPLEESEMTLGSLLCKYRLQRNISSYDLSFSLGWKDTNRLNQIESGEMQDISRDLIEKLSCLMNLTHIEKSQLLFIGNFIPTVSEIKKVRKKLHRLIDDWPYPASIRDICWRIITSNKKVFQYYQISEEMKKNIQEGSPNLLEIVFDPDFKLNKDSLLEGKIENVDKRKRFLIEMLKAFKYYQRSRTKEGWYIRLIKKMLDNELFRELWIKSSYEKIINTQFLPPFIRKTTLDSNNARKQLSTYMFITPFLEDPRFEIELYTPADVYTFHYFQKMG